MIKKIYGRHMIWPKVSTTILDNIFQLILSINLSTLLAKCSPTIHENRLMIANF